MGSKDQLSSVLVEFLSLANASFVYRLSAPLVSINRDREIEVHWLLLYRSVE